MASNARAERRRTARAVARAHGHDGDVGVMIGWAADEDALPEARRQLHDALIETMGPLRIGGVSWRQMHGDSAVDALRLMTMDEDRQEMLDHYRRLRAHLREWGGWIVIATAPGRKP